MTVMQSGPYSICRHPLYLFSTVATLGFTLMLGSLLIAVILGGGVFLILSATAKREEAFLRSEFGAAYDDYAARVPRIWPRVSLFQTEDEVTFSVPQLRRNFRDALVFVGTIPVAEAMESLHSGGVLHALPIW